MDGSEKRSVGVVGDPISTADLLDSVPEVRDRSSTCEMGLERMRGVTSVRTLVGQIPIEPVPSVVAESAKTAYRRISSPMPPSIEPHRIDLSRLRVPSFTAAALVALVAIGALLAQGLGDNEPSQSDRVQKLIESPAPVKPSSLNADR